MKEDEKVKRDRDLYIGDPRVTAERARACFFATVNGDARGRGGRRGGRRADDDIRFCARTCVHVSSPVVVPLSLFLSPSSLLLPLSALFFFFFLFFIFFFFFPFAAPSRVSLPLLPTRFSRSPWVGRSQHRPIRALLRIPTRIPDLLRRAQRGMEGARRRKRRRGRRSRT